MMTYYNNAKQFEFGLNGKAKNNKLALYNYKKAARLGYAKAIYKVGLFYENGIGIKRDLHEAIKWYTFAAKSGYFMASYKLGHLYELGKGVEKCLEEAVHWYSVGDVQSYSNREDN